MDGITKTSEPIRGSTHVLELERVVCQLAGKTSQNARVPICKLPAEILSEIFITASCVGSTKTTGRCISQVCSLWRNAALACPSIWAHMKFSKADRPKWVKEMIRRSKAALATIHWTLTPRTTDFIVTMLESVGLQRIAELTLVDTDWHTPSQAASTMWQTLLPILTKGSSSLSSLRNLSLSSRVEVDLSRAVPFELLAGDAPHLKKLDVGLHLCFNWNATWLPNLTHLDIWHADSSREGPISLERLLRVLGDMTFLENLVLHDVLDHPGASSFSTVTDHSKHLPQIRLPFLSKLHLVSDIASLMTLLSHLRLPSSTDVSVMTKGTAYVSHQSITALLRALHECGDQSSQSFANVAFRTIQLDTTHDEGVNVPSLVAFSQNLKFKVHLDDDDDDDIRALVEDTLVNFVATTLSLDELQFLQVCFSSEAVPDAYLNLFSRCEMVPCLRLVDNRDQCCTQMLELLGSLAKKTSRKRRQPRRCLYFPELHTLRILFADFRDGTAALVRVLRRRERRIHTLVIEESKGRNQSALSRLGSLVDTLSWERSCQTWIDGVLVDEDDID